MKTTPAAGAGVSGVSFTPNVWQPSSWSCERRKKPLPPAPVCSFIIQSEARSPLRVSNSRKGSTVTMATERHIALVPPDCNNHQIRIFCRVQLSLSAVPQRHISAEMNYLNCLFYLILVWCCKVYAVVIKLYLKFPLDGSLKSGHVVSDKLEQEQLWFVSTELKDDWLYFILTGFMAS